MTNYLCHEKEVMKKRTQNSKTPGLFFSSKLLHFTILVTSIIIFSLSCGTQKAVVKQEPEKIEPSKGLQETEQKEGFGWYADIISDVRIRECAGTNCKILGKASKLDTVKILSKEKSKGKSKETAKTK